MHILIAAGDEITIESLGNIIANDKNRVSIARTTEELLAIDGTNKSDVIIISDTLENTENPNPVQDIRTAGVTTPIVYLFSEPDHKGKKAISALDAGADDAQYMFNCVPEPEVLQARMRAIVKRAVLKADNIIVTGPLSVNLTKNTVEVNGREVHLPNSQLEILKLLSSRKGTTVAKEALMDRLYGGLPKSDRPEEKIIDVFMSHLRKNIGQEIDPHHPHPAKLGADLIGTDRGKGFILHDPLPESALSRIMTSAARGLENQPDTPEIDKDFMRVAKNNLPKTDFQPQNDAI